MASRSVERLETLNAFLREHPGGWNHDEWEALLGTLRARGLLDPGEQDVVGRELERERVRQTLEGLEVAGLGPKRRSAILGAFPHIWQLREARVDEIAALPALNRATAEAVVQALR